MLGRLKDRLADSNEPEIDHYELRYKPPSGESWSRATHVSTFDEDVGNLSNRLDKRNVETTAQSEGWRAGSYALQGRRTDGTLTAFLWQFGVEGEGDSRQQREPDPERVARRAAQEAVDSGGGRSVEDVLAEQIEQALNAGEHKKAALLVDEYRSLQQESDSLLDQVEVNDESVGLTTALALHGSRALVSDSGTARNLGRNLAEIREGYEEASETVDEVQDLASGLRELAEMEAAENGEQAARHDRDQDGDFRQKDHDQDSDEFKPDESIDAGASDMSELGASVGTDPDLDVGDTEAAETPESPGDTDTDAEAAADGGEDVSRCEGITESGDRCSRRAEPGSDYCYQHRESNDRNGFDPEQAAKSVADALDGDDGGVRT